ncbi:orc1/cdc6 family replication initiation protein [Methanosalsum zhilinae DSM 4017]|uniref:ORC1-type DNA replication protein n=1 Tax=Methanosalsum zhilinae (strain DSM 4017 / NBRC 107636 / OCM 62 / WeN5) TaxID=679901 RepID=F7XP58_METZD|nr:ORC1-type DNA replication protein [Methanosalsum zhilinae]AEH61350.1 orc1/cdc6 family replication initiation protein [Methanosalsum zhilinae DSM 4017]
MGKDILLWDETIFRNPEILEIDHIPEKFAHRDTQLQSLGYSLMPAARNIRPVNCLLSGPPGTGKTTAALKIFNEMKEHTNNIFFVKVNCQIDSTRFAVASRIFKNVFQISPPASGVSFRKLFEKIMDKLVQDEKTLIVALDDINYLFYEGHADHLMYSLLRAHEQYPGARIGVVVIISETGKLYQFDQKVSSVFLPEEIYFPRYNFEELQDIISNRINYAFFENVVSDEVRDLIVQYVDDTGDLRIGIDLLKRAGLNAERRADRKIIIEDVKQAYEKSRLVHLCRNIRSLTSEEKLLLGMVSQKDQTPAGELYSLFHEKTGLGYTRFYEIINKLDSLQYVDTNFSGKGNRGRTRFIRSRYPSADVLKCIEK